MALVRDEVLHQALAHGLVLGEAEEPLGATVPLLEIAKNRM